MFREKCFQVDPMQLWIKKCTKYFLIKLKIKLKFFGMAMEVCKNETLKKEDHLSVLWKIKEASVL